MKIRPVGAGLFHADGQTDITKLIVAFRISVNAPKNGDQKHLSGFPPLNYARLCLIFTKTTSSVRKAQQ